ncbi:monocarboxylate transporter 12-like isoform X1 [Carcharodon carcharias]|uniref:monocarboxylate transporter 12-like isoform X1 n=2 Tax=Carcharodon carcharias TaxID=13397 RepID=UPI001B7EA5D7|nr:monocarboxylate transporter 12-like isoform X1 [Carcharodon carcharias]XP_041063931.1 monocarboxylate transporter 12-like isoform X1 [Carcharodon carcharias]XP_041063932.1 monocarboxylate transporter 12-like isoform X1 [Carcharodon carcharias]XP_041063933.1 monocarboxylate transporter 12-like isoform X1 [Carcharodon carcharias]
MSITTDSREIAMPQELGAAEEPVNCPPTPKYTDGGYGWVILASCFIITGLSASFVKIFGIIFLDIQVYFNVFAFKVSWITAITVAVFHMCSPVASALSLLLSHRNVIIIGGILSSLGLLLGSFGFSLLAMYLTTGFLTGLGNGFAWIPSVSLVTQYFTERRPLANALASCGECVFTFIFTPFYQWLVDLMSWRQAMMIIAGIQLNLCVCGALMRPYQPQRKCLNSTTSSASTSQRALCSTGPEYKKNFTNFFDLSLLKQPKFICMVFFGFFSVVGFIIPAIYLIPHAQNIGIPDFQAALLMSYWSAGDLFGRLGCGWLANLRLMKSIRLTTIMITILSIGLMLFPVAKSYMLIIIFSCICGFFFGTMLAIIVTVLTDVMGVEKLDNSLGLIMFFRTIGCLLGPPLAGFLVDITGAYSIGFYVAGGGLFIAACFLVLADYCLSREQSSRQDTEEMVKFTSQSQPREEAEQETLATDRMTENQ